MSRTTPELRITTWSEPAPARGQLMAQLHALAPGAQITLGFTANQLCVSLEDTDASTVAALDMLLQNDFEEVVFSYRWHANGVHPA